MGEERVERRLAAILAADVVGYSRLMEANEERTLGALRQHRREFFDPTMAKHGGGIAGQRPPGRGERSEEFARRQALGGDPAFRQHEQRSRSGILQRRHHRGYHHRSVEGLGALRAWPQHCFHLQGAGGEAGADRQGTGRRLCGRGQRPQGRQPGADQRAADRRVNRRPFVGRPQEEARGEARSSPSASSNSSTVSFMHQGPSPKSTRRHLPTQANRKADSTRTRSRSILHNFPRTLVRESGKAEIGESDSS